MRLFEGAQVQPRAQRRQDCQDQDKQQAIPFEYDENPVFCLDAKDSHHRFHQGKGACPRAQQRDHLQAHRKQHPPHLHRAAPQHQGQGQQRKRCRQRGQDVRESLRHHQQFARQEGEEHRVLRRV